MGSSNALCRGRNAAKTVLKCLDVGVSTAALPCGLCGVGLTANAAQLA
jgi:hypothetical protein